jgi:transcription initiation factor TFIID subunit 7
MASLNPKPSLKVNTGQQKMPPPSTAAATPATENPRPILKLNTSSRQSSFNGDGATPTTAAERKIKIKINSQPGTPAPTTAIQTPSVTKTKAGRTSKPTAKLTESKKRGYESDEDRPLAITRAEARPSKTIKLTHKVKSFSHAAPQSVSTPVSAIRFRPKGEPVPHKPGDAYDSEASDREPDPQRENNFLLRLMDDAPAQYLKKALAEGTIGQPKNNGGADFAVQFVDSRERRAMVTINNINYAAVLVQLPTITEAMKTWDRRSMMKNSDVTEMLLCFAVVRNETEAKSVPLPPMVTKNELKWPHGITPPMHDASNRRFRKALSEKQWERTQNQVTKLLEDDAAADEVHTDLIIDDDGYGDYDDDEDAEGELDADDYFGDQTQQDMDVDAEEELEEDDLVREFLADMEDGMEDATPATQLEAPTPMTMGGNTPMPVQEEQASEEDEDEEEEISDEDEDDDEEVDDDDSGNDRERKQQLSELHELQKQLEEAEKKLETTAMPILKKRISSGIESIKKEISVKKAALGLTEDD